MTAPFEAIVAALAQALCDADQHAAGLPPVTLARHRWTAAHYRARISPLLPGIAEALAQAYHDGEVAARDAASYAWPKTGVEV